MELLGERPVWSLSDGELLPTLDQVDAAVTWLLTYRLQLVARIDDSSMAEDLGARDTAELLAMRHRIDRREAHRDVKLARAVPKYESVSTALTDDLQPLRPAHANAIVTALERVRSRVPVEDLDVAEEQLVTLAKHLSPGELATAARRICEVLDSDGPEPDEHAAYARESLTLIEAENGVKFRGYLANENAELFRSRIHAAARPHKTADGEPDPRSREKRQADALTTTLTIAAAAADADQQTAPGTGAKANITVTIDLDDLKAATPHATGDLVYGDALSAAAIRRLACDANIIPLVLGSNSEPLDVGRSERLVTRAIRRALNTRDKGCVICGAPPINCDAHHLKSWLDGGQTTITNLVLLCRRHHIALHAGHWKITITNGTVQVTRPTWADPPPQPKPPLATTATPTPAPLSPARQDPTRFARWDQPPTPQPTPRVPHHLRT